MREDSAPRELERTSYAVGLLREVEMGPEIEEYLERIDETLVPFGGRFLIHGSSPAEREGTWPGQLIVIEFDGPDGAIALFDGVAHPHRATDILRGGSA